ncbi:LysR family transcriptional regulator [Rhodovastum atsumiense]|nr:LysR family transcriptional regulator [Rhodovastum atsumiense]
MRLLATLSERKSLRAAANALSLTQPAITKNLHELEDTLGETLFVRTPRGIEPNALGEAAIRFARLIFTDLSALRDELDVLRSGGVGNVRIGSMSSQTGGVIARAVARVKREHPRVNIAVVEETSDHLLGALEEDRLDLVVARIPQDRRDDNLIFETPAEEQIEIAVGARHPARGRPDLSLADLVDHTWIAQPHPAPLRVIHDQLFREARLPLPRSLVETSSTLTTVGLLDYSDMITLLPGSLIRFYGELGLMATLPIPVPGLLLPFGLIRRRNRVLTPAMETVADALRIEVGR